MIAEDRNWLDAQIDRAMRDNAELRQKLEGSKGQPDMSSHRD